MQWSAIKYVTSGLTLAAFAIAAVAWLVARRMSQTQKVIETAPSRDRLKAAALALERFQVDVSGIKDDEQKVKLALEQLYERRRRLIVIVIAVVVIAVIGLAFTAFALTHGSSSGSSENGTSQPRRVEDDGKTKNVPEPDGHWTCRIGADTRSNVGSLYCGTDTSAWAESRTWTLHIVPPGWPANRSPRLEASVEPTSALGIAILPPPEQSETRYGSCLTEATSSKRQTLSVMTLSGCEHRQDGRFDRYDVRVVVCGSGHASGATLSRLAGAPFAELVKIAVREDEEDRRAPFPLACSLDPGVTPGGVTDSTPTDSTQPPTRVTEVAPVSRGTACTKKTGAPTWFYLRLVSVSPSGGDRIPMPEDLSPAEGVVIWDSPPDVKHGASVAGVCLAGAVSRASRKLWLEANVFGHTPVKTWIPDWLNYVDAKNPYEWQLARDTWYKSSDPSLARLSADDRSKAEDAIVNTALAATGSEVEVLARLTRYVNARPGVIGRYVALRYCGAATCADQGKLPLALRKWVTGSEALIRAEEERVAIIEVVKKEEPDPSPGPKEKSIVIEYLEDPSSRALLGVSNKEKTAARAYIEKRLPPESAAVLLPLVNHGFDVYIDKLPHGEWWHPDKIRDIKPHDIKPPVLDRYRSLPP